MIITKTLFQFKHTILLLVTLAILIFPITTTLALEDDRLYLVYYDCETQEQLSENTKILYEGQQYDIGVGSIGNIGYIYDVTITLPWESYKTNRETPWISITTPSYQDYPEGFSLTAAKEGYSTIEEYVQVFTGKLAISQDRGIVDEGDYFTVTVTDHTNQPIENVELYLEYYGKNVGDITTNKNGLAFIQAPDLQESTDITLRAFKEGYQPGSTSIHVEHTPAVLSSHYILLLLAFIILCASMLIVHIRKQRHTQKISKKLLFPKKKKTVPHLVQTSTVQPKQSIKPTSASTTSHAVRQKSSRVEEIRLSAAGKKRETNYISPKHKQESTSSVNPHKWIEAPSNVKYKIDEITGEIDPKRKDKWFEGVDNIKEKVDKKLKKNYKQKDV